MRLLSWLRQRTVAVLPNGRNPSHRRSPSFRPRLEPLEGRCLPSTLTVQNNLDSGSGSLRADIAAAHNGDTIVFAPRLDGQTITLTSGEILIKQNLAIAGPGAGELTVSGNHASRVFEVAKGTQVSLSGLTISNGLVAVASRSDDGGGIENYGTLTVRGSTLSGNSAFEGGGIYNHASSTLTVSNSTLSANVATNDGGGIANYGTATVSGASTVSGNSGGGDGGGIFNNGTLTVSGSTLFGNSAYRGGGGGGGIANYATLTVNGSILSGNSAYRGGGIENYGTLTVSGSTLSGNSASDGGGIFNGSGTVTVKNSSSITGNSAPVDYGADIRNQGVLYLDSSSMIGILDGNPAAPI